jgi:hypothetical protein
MPEVVRYASAQGADQWNILIVQNRILEGLQDQFQDLLAHHQQGINIERICFDPASFDNIVVEWSTVPAAQNLWARGVGIIADISTHVPGEVVSVPVQVGTDPRYAFFPGFANTYAYHDDNKPHHRPSRT